MKTSHNPLKARCLTEVPAIVAFAAGVILTVLVLGVVLALLNQSVEVI